jgi:hypothetical protein
LRYAALFAFLGACGGGGGDDTIDITHDVCTPLDVLTSFPSDAQATGISSALDLWRVRGAPFVGQSGDATIEVRFERAALSFHGLYDDENGVIYINSEITDPSAMSIVIAHELGHAFGLGHITERTSLMNPGNLAMPPNAEDEAALQALWGHCP